MKVYVTKYALTLGIQKVVCDEQTELQKDEGYVWTGRGLYAGKEWHKCGNDAVLQAEAMRDRKIASLEKQLAKLRAMTFTVPK